MNNSRKVLDEKERAMLEKRLRQWKLFFRLAPKMAFAHALLILVNAATRSSVRILKSDAAPSVKRNGRRLEKNIDIRVRMIGRRISVVDAMLRWAKSLLDEAGTRLRAAA